MAVGEVVGSLPVVEDLVAVLDGLEVGGKEMAGEEDAKRVERVDKERSSRSKGC